MTETPIICRLCLSKTFVCHSLLEDNGKEMLLSLIGISVSENTEVSNSCCFKCWYDLRCAYRIQQKFIEGDEKFQQLMNYGIDSVVVPQIKLEVEDDTFDIPNSVVNVEEPHNNADERANWVPPKEIANTAVNQESSCFICGHKCLNSRALNDHINQHYEKGQECNDCSIKFPNFATYKKHLKNFHADSVNNTYICKFCALCFSHYPFYQLHLKSFHPNGVESVNSTITTKEETQRPDPANRDVETFGENDQVADLDIDMGEPADTDNTLADIIDETEVIGSTIQKRKECPVCHKNVTIYNLNKHILSHEDKPTICEVCGKIMKNPVSLRWHLRSNHNPNPQFCCETCGKKFKRKQPYIAHMRTHSGEKPFTCDLCGKRFSQKKFLTVHIKGTHLKERPYVCQYCNKGFSSSYSLRTHKRQHTNETPYVCEECGEGFRQKISLRTHRISKHNIQEDRKVECPECHKMFISEDGLKVHHRTMHEYKV